MKRKALLSDLTPILKTTWAKLRKDVMDGNVEFIEETEIKDPNVWQHVMRAAELNS